MNLSIFGGKFAINGYNFLLISFVCYILQTRCYWSSFRWIYTKGGFKTNRSNTLKEKGCFIYLRWSKCQFKQLVRGVVVWLSSCCLACLYTTKYNLMQVFLGLVELTNISLIKQLLVSNFVAVLKLGFAVLLREIFLSVAYV